MSPQITVARPISINAPLIVRSNQAVASTKPTVRAADVSSPTRSAIPNAAERERQEALEFLHKLVMAGPVR